MAEKAKQSVQEEPKKVSKGRKQNKEVLEQIEKIEEVSQEPKPKVLSPHEVEKLRRLAGEIHLADKDVQLITHEIKEYDYKIKLIDKERQLMDKTAEIVRLQKELVNQKKKDSSAVLTGKQSAYKKLTDEISVKFALDFSKCSFDPETGVIELL